MVHLVGFYYKSISVALKLEAACSTEILEHTCDDSTQRKNPRNCHLSIISCEKLKIKVSYSLT